MVTYYCRLLPVFYCYCRLLLYQVELREKEVKYINALGQFLDPHTLQCTGIIGYTCVYVFVCVFTPPNNNTPNTSSYTSLLHHIYLEQKVVKKEVKEIVTTTTSHASCVTHYLLHPHVQ